ncbi:hypothetical protein PQX77_016374 [Marasmius sp. AFHP31]|nr:hypothetical protein PQX77_016374 [Marasmius sp. AFHP31]
MSYKDGRNLEVPKAPKLGTKPLSLDDEDLLPGIPIKLNNFDFEPEDDIEMAYTSQSPTPTQNNTRGALFVGPDDLKTAFDSPSKRSHSEYGYGNDSNAAQRYRSSSNKHVKLEKREGKGKEMRTNSGKGKGRSTQTPYEAGEYDDDFSMNLDDPNLVGIDGNDGWEPYDPAMFRDHQEYKPGSGTRKS